jgi:diaminopimelate decarboxylase
MSNTRKTYSYELLEPIAAKVGTPFWLIDAEVLRARIAEVKAVAEPAGIQVRYAMKALSATAVLREMRAAGMWIDAVSGNEVLRALHAGFPGGQEPPVIVLTADVFRGNALDVVLQKGILPNIGSPGMITALAEAGYRGNIAVRVNPGFGHGHVNACDTGGPSSKHGIWYEHLGQTIENARKHGLRLVMLHAHIGSGPKITELLQNLRRLVREYAALLAQFSDVEAVSLGGGIPHTYKETEPPVDISPLRELFTEAKAELEKAAKRPLRVEIEPGRYFVAPCATLVTRVTDVKKTETNPKGPGRTFAMVDAGFVDLVRPAMYGSYHRMVVVGRGAANPPQDIVVAGPLCESGDVFTRDASELLAPRRLPRPEPGDLLCIHDGGAYGYVMSSNYNSIGRAPQVWLEPDGSLRLISRRETVEDLLRIETDEAL